MHRRAAPAVGASEVRPAEAPGPQPRPRAGPGHRGGGDGRRPLGRPRRQERRRRRRGRGHAHADLAPSSMNGVVVIGEGEKDNAPMLFNGERVGDGTGPECDVAVDPIDGTTLTAKGQTNAIAVLAVADRGAMYDPSAPCSTWTSWRPAPRPPTSSTSGCRSPRTSAASPRPRTSSPDDVTVVHARPAAPRAAGRGGPRDRAPGIRFISDGDVAGADHGGPRRTPASTCCSASAAPPRASSPPARSSASAASIQGRLWPKDDDERQRALDAGHDLDRGPVHRRPGPRRQRASSSRPASPTASCCEASATAPAARPPTRWSCAPRAAPSG